MTKNNQNSENQNTLMAWFSDYAIIYAVGIAAGIFIWETGLIQKAKDKIFSKKEE